LFFGVFDSQNAVGGANDSTTATNNGGAVFGDEGGKSSSSSSSPSYSTQFLATATTTTRKKNNISSSSSNNRKIHRGMDDDVTISNAAFSLLQWAHYGPDLDLYDMGTNNGNCQDGSKTNDSNNIDNNDNSNDDDADNDYDAVLEEDIDTLATTEHTTPRNEAEDDDVIPEWAEKALMEREEERPQYREMEAPLSFKVRLRPYQRQALYWMTQREAIASLPGTESHSIPEWKLWRKEQMDLLKEISTTTTTNNCDVRVESMSSQTYTNISCDCGPVRVNADQVRAPSASDVLLDRVKIFGSPCSVTNDVEDEDDLMLSHPLWDRRFLCNANQTVAISFFVQPFLRKAIASTPSPPKFCSGGILADSMGLGKTVMLLALIASSRENDVARDRDVGTIEVAVSGSTNKSQHNKCTLIVTPLSLLLQWQDEIETKTTLSHRVYYGENKCSKSGQAFMDVDIVLTTYGSLQAELQSYRKNKHKGMAFNGASPLLSVSWKRVILDEAHIIKNHTTLVAKSCSFLQAERRWCVSGTIIQNSLEDVYSLMKFLRHEPWCEHGFWRASITNAPDHTRALDRVRRILCPIMLRRTKETHVNGKPILSLPAIDCRTVKVEFTPAERQFYDALFQKSMDIFNGYIQAGTASSSWIKIFSLLHRLRQTCCHVALTVKGHLDDEAWTSMISQAATVSATGILKGCDTIREKYDPLEDVKEEIDQGFLKDLLYKFKTVHADRCIKDGECVGKDENDLNEGNYASRVARKLNDAIQTNSLELKEECSICLENLVIEKSVITPCLHLFCQTCLMDVLKDKLSGKYAGHCPVCSEEIDSKKILQIERSTGGRLHTNYLCKKLAPEGPVDHCDEAARATLQHAVNGGSSSSKLDAIYSELESLWNQKPCSKVVVFSQFMGMLDLLAQRFVSASIPYERLDGKLSLKERMGVLRRFGSESHPMLDESSSKSRVGSVLLISMKAGGVVSPFDSTAEFSSSHRGIFLTI
jgi:SNF2 family DNA or RNA helicase